MKRIFGLVLAILCLFPLGEVKAENRTHMTFEDVVQALIRFGAINIANDDVIDAYTMTMECDLYKHFYGDDFKWQKIRKAMRKEIKQNVSLYPTVLHYDAKLQLDRYSFKDKLFKFSDKATIKNANAFLLDAYNVPYCVKKYIPVFPRAYRAVVDHPLYVLGLPLSEADAENLLKRMKEAGNVDRIIFTRFNFRIVYIAPLRKVENRDDYSQSAGTSPDSAVRIDVRLENIEFFEDDARTKLIYTYSE